MFAAENWHNSSVSVCNRTIVAASFAIRVQLAYTERWSNERNDRLHSIFLFFFILKCRFVKANIKLEAISVINAFISLFFLSFIEPKCCLIFVDFSKSRGKKSNHSVFYTITLFIAYTTCKQSKTKRSRRRKKKQQLHISIEMLIFSICTSACNQ